MLLFLPLSIPIENCILVRRYDWFFWVIQFSPLLLQTRYHTIPFMFKLLTTIWGFFFLVSILPFGGCLSILISAPLKYVHGLLILLSSWSNLVLEYQWPFLHRGYCPKVWSSPACCLPVLGLKSKVLSWHVQMWWRLLNSCETRTVV